MKKVIIISIFLVKSLLGFSQQDPQYNLYMFNPLSVNPGYAGSREALSAVLIHRSQWIQLDGAPETQAFSMNFPLKNKTMGLGFQVTNDKIGPKTTQNISASYAYRLRLWNGKIALGMRAGVLNYNYNWNEIEYKDGSDPIPTGAPENFALPSIDFGLYYNTSSFYAGISVDHLNQASFNLINNTDSVSSEARVYSVGKITVAKAFILNKNFVLKTSALIRASNSTGNIDLYAGLLLKNRVLFGFIIKGRATSLLAEINLTKKLRMGMAYEIDGSSGDLSPAGSLEFFVGYDINIFKSQVSSPRYF